MTPTSLLSLLRLEGLSPAIMIDVTYKPPYASSHPGQPIT